MKYNPQESAQVTEHRKLKLKYPEDYKKREPGCLCHWEEGDSPCPIHKSEEEDFQS